MKNSIDARVIFSFKGEAYSPSATIDLDACLEQLGTLPPLHSVIAKANGIDTYSYLYEVMEMSEIEFHNPKGLAVECLTGGHFDLKAFEGKWRESQVLSSLLSIAADEMGVQDFGQHPALKRALLQAYALGAGAGKISP